MLRFKHKLFALLLLVISINSFAQVTYQLPEKDGFSFGSYGRVGVDWSFEHGGSIGRRLNLNNMGSIGGRMEEQDYLELYPAFHFTPFKKDDPTLIKVQMRFAVYSQSLSLFGNSSTSSIGGLTIAMPEIYAEAKNINGKDLNIWIGARLYRTEELFIADHFFFDDHSGQGFGIEYKHTRFSTFFVSSTDTSSNVPPYFYLNIGNGVSNIALRQRVVGVIDHEFSLAENNKLTVMGEFHYMSKTNTDENEVTPIEEPDDSTDIYLNYPMDYGLVFGTKLITNFKNKYGDGINKLAIRYGTRIANGGDGGVSKTWLTFGAPDLNKVNYSKAYSLAIVEEVKFNLSENNNFNGYIVFTQSKGGAQTDGKAKTYWGREVYNRKKDLTFGFRDTYYIKPKFHLLTEFHYSQRKDGTDNMYRFQKISIAPTLVPTGKKDTGARPHLRFVCSLAHYNNAAKENLYSPFLQFVGHKQWGYYFGVKMEWWI